MDQFIGKQRGRIGTLTGVVHNNFLLYSRVFVRSDVGLPSIGLAATTIMETSELAHVPRDGFIVVSGSVTFSVVQKAAVAVIVIPYSVKCWSKIGGIWTEEISIAQCAMLHRTLGSVRSYPIPVMNWLPDPNAEFIKFQLVANKTTDEGADECTVICDNTNGGTTFISVDCYASEATNEIAETNEFLV